MRNAVVAQRHVAAAADRAALRYTAAECCAILVPLHDLCRGLTALLLVYI